MTRPPLMSSIVSVILATRPGLRKPVQATSDPIWMRSVALARPAMSREALPDATVLFIRGYLELAIGLRPKHEVVDDPDRIKAGVFGRARHGQDVGKVGRASECGVLGDRQDDPDAHRAIADRPAAFRGGCHRAGSVPVPALRHRSPPARLRRPHGSRRAARAGDLRNPRNSEAPVARGSVSQLG